MYPCITYIYQPSAPYLSPLSFFSLSAGTPFLPVMVILAFDLINGDKPEDDFVIKRGSTDENIPSV